MSGDYLQSLAQLVLALGLLCGIAVGWYFADVIELYRRKHP